jgi:CRP-like cAMP-binding protein
MTAEAVDLVEPVGWTDARGGAATRYSRAWSPDRLSAAIAAARRPGGRTAIERPLDDELEFFASVGARRDVAHGVTLIHGGETIREVHLIVRGAVAVVGDRGERRPILGFKVPNHLCGPVPVLLREPALWDVVTVMESSVMTIPAARFAAAVRDRWVDRWSTRSLSWLAAMGARSADLDCDLTGQTAALLLRHRGEMPAAVCRRTIVDLLDADEKAIERILRDFERVGAVRLRDGRIAITQVEILKSTVAAARRARTREPRRRTF